MGLRSRFSKDLLYIAGIDVNVNTYMYSTQHILDGTCVTNSGLGMGIRY